MLFYKRPKDVDKMLCCFPKHANRTGKAFAFPWPHEAHSTPLGNTPRNPRFSQSICSLWLWDRSSTSKAQKKCWQYINPSVFRDPITTFNQCFPYLSRAITPVIVQNANSPMLVQWDSHNDKMKPRGMEVCIVKHLRRKGKSGGKMQKWTNVHT